MFALSAKHDAELGNTVLAHLRGNSRPYQGGYSPLRTPLTGTSSAPEATRTSPELPELPLSPSPTAHCHTAS
eukprot:15484225-Alexandrium_andersonii.AAC.1